MKYLHDERLSELTTFLTDLSLGGAVSQRVVHGRIEAYTMKRGTDDKKYAYRLGEKYVASLEHTAEEYSTHRALIRKRSVSAGIFEELTTEQHPQEPISKLPRRSRASSFDTTRSEMLASQKRHEEMRELVRIPFSMGSKVPSALGDFSEQATRRLMTDLVLTLNGSFPDFDFGAVRPTDFAHLSVRDTVSRVNKLLSDVALRKDNFLSDLWSSIDAVINLADCDVYTYQPVSADDQDEDPMAFLTETLTEGFAPDMNKSSPGSLEVNPSTDSVGSQPTTMWTFNYFFVNKTVKRIVLFTCVESMRNREPDNEDDDAYFASSVGESTEVDFDLDPACAPAGGIPISSV